MGREVSASRRQKRGPETEKKPPVERREADVACSSRARDVPRLASADCTESASRRSAPSFRSRGTYQNLGRDLRRENNDGCP